VPRHRYRVHASARSRPCAIALASALSPLQPRVRRFCICRSLVRSRSADAAQTGRRHDPVFVRGAAGAEGTCLALASVPERASRRRSRSRARPSRTPRSRRRPAAPASQPGGTTVPGVSYGASRTARVVALVRASCEHLRIAERHTTPVSSNVPEPWPSGLCASCGARDAAPVRATVPLGPSVTVADRRRVGPLAQRVEHLDRDRQH
jgi:hypothetical protein